jgi:hypothetical protein
MSSMDGCAPPPGLLRPIDAGWLPFTRPVAEQPEQPMLALQPFSEYHNARAQLKRLQWKLCKLVGSQPWK